MYKQFFNYVRNKYKLRKFWIKRNCKYYHPYTYENKMLHILLNFRTARVILIIYQT